MSSERKSYASPPVIPPSASRLFSFSRQRAYAHHGHQGHVASQFCARLAPYAVARSRPRSSPWLLDYKVLSGTYTFARSQQWRTSWQFFWNIVKRGEGGREGDRSRSRLLTTIRVSKGSWGTAAIHVCLVRVALINRCTIYSTLPLMHIQTVRCPQAVLVKHRSSACTIHASSEHAFSDL